MPVRRQRRSDEELERIIRSNAVQLRRQRPTLHAVFSTNATPTYDMIIQDGDEDDDERAATRHVPWVPTLSLEALYQVLAAEESNEAPARDESGDDDHEYDSDSAHQCNEVDDEAEPRNVKSDQYMAVSIWAYCSHITHKDWTALAEIFRTLNTSTEQYPWSLTTLVKDLRMQLNCLKMLSWECPLSVRSVEPQGAAARTVQVFDQVALTRSILELPDVHDSMYFGPAMIEVDGVRSEFYHGDAWAESIRCASGEFPRYNEDPEEAIFQGDCIIYTRAANDTLAGRVIRIWRVKDTNGATSWQLQIQPLIQHSASEWTLFEDDIRSISPDCIQRRFRLRQLTPFTTAEEAGDSLPCSGTLTRSRLIHGTLINGDTAPKDRPAYSRLRILAEGEVRAFGRAFLQKNFVTRTKVVKSIPFTLFCDGFALYRTLWKSSSGFYMCPANLPWDQRKLQSNWYVLTLTPFGVAFADVVGCLQQSASLLCRGIDMRLNGQCTYVSAFPLALLGDMPQQAQNLGCKSQNSNLPCQRCLIPKSESMNLDFDHVTYYRYDDLMDSVRSRMRDGTKSTREGLANEYGLLPDESPWQACFPGIVLFRQCPVDANHSEFKGMSSRYLNLLLEGILTTSGQKAYREALSNFVNPPGWQSFQNPITHRKSYGFTELVRLLCITPYLLDRAICKRDIKNHAFNILTGYAEHLPKDGDQPRSTDGLWALVRTYVELADHLSNCLRSSYGSEATQRAEVSCIKIRKTFQHLVRCYDKVTFEDQDLATQVADSLEKLPNVHIGVHLASNIQRYGGFQNVSTSQGEEKHKLSKSAVTMTNPGQDPISQLMDKISVDMALSFAARAHSEDLSYVPELLRRLRVSHPRLYKQAFKDQTRLQEPVYFPGSRVIDVDSSQVRLCQPWSLAMCRSADLRYDLKHDLALGQQLSTLYQSVNLAIYDVGRRSLAYGTSINIVRHGRQHKYRVGDVYMGEHDAPCLIKGLFQHSQHSFVWLETLRPVGRDMILDMDVFTHDETRLGSLTLHLLGCLFHSQQVHMVPVPAQSTSQVLCRLRHVVHRSAAGDQRREVQQDLRAFNAPAYYLNRWWVELH